MSKMLPNRFVVKVLPFSNPFLPLPLPDTSVSVSTHDNNEIGHGAKI